MLGRFVGPLTRRALIQTQRDLAEALVVLSSSNDPAEIRAAHETVATAREALSLHQILISIRQASEWGMKALQGTFARIKGRPTSDSEKRLQIIYSILLLHNFRTSEVGLNQIATVFDPEYEAVNFSGYDRIARFLKLPMY